MSQLAHARVETVKSAHFEGIVVHGPKPRPIEFASIGDMLRRSAALRPDGVFLQQRSPQGWSRPTYTEVLGRARRAAEVLLSLGLSQERPLAILSGNSITHAVASLGAQLAGIPVAPISTAYSQFGDLGRLRDIFDLLTPGAVFAEGAQSFARGLQLAYDMDIATTVDDSGPLPAGALRWSELLSSPSPGADLPAVEPGAVAKIQFTSGSTGGPKGVIVTHSMMCSNQEAIAQNWPFLDEEEQVIVDWLPWNHTFGGNLVFNCALRHAGTLVIDEGRPVPGQFDATLRNLAEAGPTVHFGVPRGFTELVRALSQDGDLARNYFRRLRAVFSAGAALPRDVWDSYRVLGRTYGRPDLTFFIGWGSTETSPVASISPPDNDRPDNIGVPLPGAAIKLVPVDERYELRVKGPMVTPGYWRREELAREAFDDDGYYRIGDAGRLLDPALPEKGILFDGRVAENFKLLSGTWVVVNALRIEAITAAAPLVQDAVVTGHDRDEIGLLIFLNLAACRDLMGAAHATAAQAAAHGAVRDALAKALAKIGTDKGSAARVARALILEEPASMEAGEMTDKGYLNQRAVLRARSDLVARLHAEPTHESVILAAG